MNEPVGTLIARLRIERGWSQTCLAQQLNEVSSRCTLDRTLVSRWEQGRRAPGPYWQPHIAKLLGIDPAELREVIRAWYAVNKKAHRQLSSTCPHTAGRHYAPSVRYHRFQEER